MGKQLKFILVFLICLLIYYCGLSINVYANDYNTYSFDVDNIDIKAVDETFVNTLTVSMKEMKDQNIMNFDVDKNGNIIICLNNNSVNVYNNALEFLYNIDFDVNGTSIAFWYNEIPAIYLSKTDEIIQVDKNGIISAYKVKNTLENSKTYRQIRGNRTIVNENCSYKLCYSSSLQKAMMIDPTKMVRVNKEKQEIVYENRKATTNALIKLSMFILFVLFIWRFIVKKILKTPLRKT